MYVSLKGKIKKIVRKSENKVTIHVSQYGGRYALVVLKDDTVKLADKLEEGKEVIFSGGIFSFYDSNESKTITILYADEVV